MAEPTAKTLRLYGNESTDPALEWEWVEQHLEEAGIYWLVTTRPDQTPHPRPVWGVWLDNRLLLSVGSGVHANNVKERSRVSVHLDSGLDVVIVEGMARYERDRGLLERFIEVYNPKYDWDFTVETAGFVLVIEPDVVMGWRSRGLHGRDGWDATGKWSFET